MKKIIIILFIGTIVSMSFTKTTNKKIATIILTSYHTKSPYCRGWKAGYCEGWKDVKGQYALCPLTPLCPLPKLTCTKGYRCGYNRGFKAGIFKAHKR